MSASEMTLARYYAKQAVKAQYQAQGLKLHNVKAVEINRAAETYLSNHPELITKACATLTTLAQRAKH
jgi:hypothetical protein